MELFKHILGLPPLASKEGARVDNLIIYMHWLMIALFFGWLIYFIYAIYRFHHTRHAKADYTGVKNHASSWVEGAVAVIEGALLLVVALPVWASHVEAPKESDASVVQVVAQQFLWNVRYPGKDGVFGKQDMHLVTSDNAFGVDPADPNGKDDIVDQNRIHVVVDKPVIVQISSKDVIHSFKVLAMRVTQDAIPGMRIPVHFTPTKTGIYQINCAQLCGQGHAAMAGGFLIVETQKEYDDWMATQKPPATTGVTSFQ